MPVTYWCEQAGPKLLRTASCQRFEWAIDHNPFFAGRVERVLLRVLEENGWSPDSITYRREWRGEWVPLRPVQRRSQRDRQAP